MIGGIVWRIDEGDALTCLRAMPDQSVQTCVTSPPYWGLRDYGHAGQLGLEATPAEYVERLAAILAEVRRVLRDDGTLWCNLGDSYAGARGGKQGLSGQLADRSASKQGARAMHGTRRGEGFKSKDLVGIPWSVAFALRDAGWFLRSDIIWSKPNPTPESVTDRPTKAHEYIFLLSKSDRYFYDADAIAETSLRAGEFVRTNGGSVMGEFGRTREGLRAHNVKETRNKRTVWTIPSAPFPEAHFAAFPEEIPRLCILAGSRLGDVVLDPFAGSGTTGAIATAIGRSFVGVEINPEYAAMARRRIRRDGAPLFAREAAR